MKTCSKCREVKPLDEFARDVATRSGTRGVCKSCNSLAFAAWKAANADPHRVSTARRRRERRDECRARLDKLKTDMPCVDCGGRFHPVQMDFDHLPGAVKLSGVSAMIGTHAWPAIQREVEKCELVCANCHRLRTHIRARGKLHD